MLHQTVKSISPPWIWSIRYICFSSKNIDLALLHIRSTSNQYPWQALVKWQKWTPNSSWQINICWTIGIYLNHKHTQTHTEINYRDERSLDSDFECPLLQIDKTDSNQTTHKCKSNWFNQIDTKTMARFITGFWL